jgi:hypothetical protein
MFKMRIQNFRNVTHCRCAVTVTVSSTTHTQFFPELFILSRLTERQKLNCMRKAGGGWDRPTLCLLPSRIDLRRRVGVALLCAATLQYFKFDLVFPVVHETGNKERKLSYKYN